jgi:hypothetical protein
LFRNLYSQLKSEINASDEFEYDSGTVFTPLPMPTCILSDSTDTCGLGPIFRMAQSQFIDSQMEASRTLCDLSADENMRESLCQLGCMPVLKQLLECPCEWVQHHAAVALANLSDSWTCHEHIIQADILPVLLALGREGHYQYKELRVLAVYILANVSSSCASVVIQRIGPETVASWFRSLGVTASATPSPSASPSPSLQANSRPSLPRAGGAAGTVATAAVVDERLQLHAKRALVSLTAVLH